MPNGTRLYLQVRQIFNFTLFYTHNTNKSNVDIFYAQICMTIPFIFVVLAAFNVSIFIVAQFWSSIISVALSRNMSQSHHLLTFLFNRVTYIRSHLHWMYRDGRDRNHARSISSTYLWNA